MIFSRLFILCFLWIFVCLVSKNCCGNRINSKISKSMTWQTMLLISVYLSILLRYWDALLESLDWFRKFTILEENQYSMTSMNLTLNKEQIIKM